MQKFLLRCGAAAAVIYVVAVLLGGLFTRDYSHVSQTISELMAPGGPTVTVHDALFFVYYAAVLLFAFGLLWRLLEYGRRNLIFGSLLLALLAGFGIAMYFLPMDQPGGPITLIGQLHIVLAAACALLMLLAPLFIGLGFGSIPGLRLLWLYSLFTAFVVAVAGVMTTAGASTGSPILGIYDRVATGAFLLWMLVLGLALPRRPQPATPEPQPAAPAPELPTRPEDVVVAAPEPKPADGPASEGGPGPEGE